MIRCDTLKAPVKIHRIGHIIKEKAIPVSIIKIKLKLINLIKTTSIIKKERII